MFFNFIHQQLLTIFLVALPTTSKQIATLSSTSQLLRIKELLSRETGCIQFPLTPKLDAVRLPRNLLQGNDSAVKLHGTIRDQGYYCASIQLGSPPHSYCLITDTGSTITYVPCDSCNRKCGRHLHKPFSPASSHTAQYLKCEDPQCTCEGQECGCTTKEQCSYQRNYVENSKSSGLMIRDVVKFSNSWSAKAVFGCELEESGQIYYQQADGVLGLGISSNSILKQISQSLNLTWEFSLCYGGFEGGGAMLIGNPQSFVNNKLQYTPMITTTQHSQYIIVRLNSIVVQDDQIEDDFDGGYGVVMDSGSTFTYLSTHAYTQFIEVMKKLLNKKLESVKGDLTTDVCFGRQNNKNDLRHVFPQIQFNFEGISLSLQPQNYLFQNVRVRGSYCVGIFDNGQKGTVLGGALFRDVLVHYDIDNKRVGMQPFQCSNISRETFSR